VVSPEDLGLEPASRSTMYDQGDYRCHTAYGCESSSKLFVMPDGIHCMSWGSAIIKLLEAGETRGGGAQEDASPCPAMFNKTTDLVIHPYLVVRFAFRSPNSRDTQVATNLSPDRSLSG
jgi:hypothetical protein